MTTILLFFSYSIYQVVTDLTGLLVSKVSVTVSKRESLLLLEAR